jgi:DNA invertase Pin-like site-specific DNA recombinase
MNAVGYIRVSTQGQVEDGCSLVLQQEKVEQYCRLNDLELLTIMQDAGKSGTRMDREGLERVKRLVEDGKVAHVVIYKLDRMARNLRGAIEFSDFLQQHDCQLHSVSEKIDTSSPAGRLFFAIMGAMGAFEVEQLRLRTKQALQGKKDRGEVYNHVAYGLCLSDDGKHLVVNPDEQKVIRRIRKFHKDGASFNEIARRLNTLGHLTKTGKAWRERQVARILQS